MKRHIKKLLMGMFLLLLVVGAAMLIRHRKAELADMEKVPDRPVPVYLHEAEAGRITVSDHYLAIIEPAVSASLSSRVTGALYEVHKDTGDFAAEGELVAVIDDRPIRQEYAAKKAELTGAEAELADRKDRYERRKALFRKGHVNEEDLETAKSAFISARARLDRLRAEIKAAEISLTYTEIRAPFDGVVTERFKDPGDLVMPGQAVCTLEDPEAGYKVKVTVPQEKARQIRTGDAAILSAGRETANTVVSRIYPALDRNLLATVEIRTDHPPFGLPSRASVGVDLVSDTPHGIVLPRRAVLDYGNRTVALVAVGGNSLKAAEVSVLGREKDRVAIAPGPVAPGDRVVVGDESMLIRLGPHTRIQPIAVKAFEDGR